MINIYKRGKIYWIRYSRNGKQYRESTKSTKLVDAKRLLKKREGEIAIGKIPGVYFDRIRFEELADDLLTDYQINQQKSLHTLRQRINNHLSPFFGNKRAPEITTPFIKKYIEKRLEEGAANSTVNRDLAALKRMLNLGAKQTPPKVDRVPYISMLKENNVRKGFFEHEEYLALKGKLPDHLKGYVTFAYKSGWRTSEISDLKWKQVDLIRGVVRLEPGESKNKEARIVYMDKELKEVFKREWNRRKKLRTALPYVFLNRKGTDKIKRFDKSWKSACRNAGLGPKIFHDLRRTAVRNMVRAGIPERVAMQISGHKTRSVFERYNIVSEDDLRLAAQKQEAYFENQTSTKSSTIVDFDKKKGLNHES